MTAIQVAKAALRTRLRERLAAMTAAEREAQSAAICRRVSALDGFSKAEVVLLYRPLTTEVDVKALGQGGVALYFPRLAADDSSLQFVRVREDTEWAKSALGFWEPRSNDFLRAEDAARAAVIVPGLGFTAGGDRLGRGRGHYDRTLAGLPLRSAYRIGVAFAEQLLDAVPIGPDDVRMHAVVTAERSWQTALPLRRDT